jgi:hypothetical protein
MSYLNISPDLFTPHGILDFNNAITMAHSRIPYYDKSTIIQIEIEQLKQIQRTMEIDIKDGGFYYMRKFLKFDASKKLTYQTCLNEISNLINKFQEIIILNPSINYPPLITFNFGSIRCPSTSFDLNYKRDSDTSMLFFIYTHGSIATDEEDNIIVHTCHSLNKFSASGAGQCTYMSETAAKYIAYALNDAVNNDGILDISTILREGDAHRHALEDPKSAITTYNETLPTAVSQHNEGLANQSACLGEFDEIVSSQILGDKTTLGTEFVEKYYIPDDDDSNCIFICKDWPEIGAKQMDNLLENQLFINYMLTRYKKDLTKSIKKFITGEDVVCIRTTLLSNIIDFSEKNGRGDVSIVDRSCSVILGDHPYTAAQIAEYSRTLDQLGPTVAKGKTKRKKTKRKKTKRKKTKRKKTKRKKTKRGLI